MFTDSPYLMSRGLRQFMYAGMGTWGHASSSETFPLSFLLSRHRVFNDTEEVKCCRNVHLSH